MSCAAYQLSDGGQLFGLCNLGLQELQVDDGLLRLVEQAEQFAIEQTLAYKNENAHEKRGAQGQDQAEGTNARRDARIQQSPGGKQGQRKNRDHAYTRKPDAMRGGIGARAGI